MTSPNRFIIETSVYYTFAVIDVFSTGDMTLIRCSASFSSKHVTIGNCTEQLKGSFYRLYVVTDRVTNKTKQS